MQFPIYFAVVGSILLSVLFFASSTQKRPAEDRFFAELKRQTETSRRHSTQRHATKPAPAPEMTESAPEMASSCARCGNGCARDDSGCARRGSSARDGKRLRPTWQQLRPRWQQLRPTWQQLRPSGTTDSRYARDDNSNTRRGSGYARDGNSYARRGSDRARHDICPSGRWPAEDPVCS